MNQTSPHYCLTLLKSLLFGLLNYFLLFIVYFISSSDSFYAEEELDQHNQPFNMDQNRNSIPDSFTQRFYGLINQGSTCYLNSVLQVLFMTKDFRQAVKRSSKDNKEHIDLQLHRLFDKLSRGTAKTVEVTQKLGIDRVNEQHDAAEYLEKILILTSDEASQIFEGQLTNRTVCECGAVSDEEKPFWNLPLPLKNSSVETYSVVDGIQEFFKVSHVHGDDQLYCEECDAKRDATVSCILQQHPEVLMLLLKRFEFNYHHMTYIKNSRVVEVPLTVTIPENQKYELYAFVNHYGSLTGGHYTATIRSQDDQGRWYNFNDSSVTQLDNQPFKKDKSEKSERPYLLFYRKKSKTYTDTKDNRKVSNTHSPPLDNSRTTDWCQPGSKRKNEGDAGGIKEKVRIKNSSNDLSAEESTDLWDENLHDSKDHAKQKSGRSCSEKGNGQAGYSHKSSDRHYRENEGKSYLDNGENMGRKLDPSNRTDVLFASKSRKSCEKSDNSGANGHTGREDGDRSQKMEKTQSDRMGPRRYDQGELTSSLENSRRETRDVSGQQNLHKDKVCKEDPSSRNQKNHQYQGETKMGVQGDNRGMNNRKIDTTEAERQEPRNNSFKQQSFDYASDERRVSSGKQNLSKHQMNDMRRSMQRRLEFQGVIETEGQGDRGMTPVGKDLQKKQTSETKEQKRSSSVYSESIKPEAPLIKQTSEMENKNDEEENLIKNNPPQTEERRKQEAGSDQNMTLRNSQTKETKKKSFRRFFKIFCCCCCQKKSGKYPNRRHSKNVEVVTETRISEDSTPKRKKNRKKTKKQNQD